MAVCALLLAVGVFWGLRSPEPSATSSAEAPPATALPAPEEPVVVVHRSRHASSPPAGANTVDAEDEEALEERRTQTRLFGSARVRAIYDNETLLGIRIENVTPGSFWEDVGVRDGDVVLEVNGRLVDQPEASVELMNSLSLAHVLILRVRGVDGRERYLEYRTPRG